MAKPSKVNYPYLGVKEFGTEEDGAPIMCIVFFTSKDEGAVIYSTVDDEDYKLGRNDTFDEEEFEFYEKGKCVTLANE